MASYIDADDIDALLGTATRQDLFATVNGTYVTAWFSNCIIFASELVRVAAFNSGYSNPSADNAIKVATLGQFMIMAYGRKQKTPPAIFAEMLMVYDKIVKGEFQFPDQTPTAQDAVGGSSFSETDATQDNSREPIMDRDGLSGF